MVDFKSVVEQEKRRLEVLHPTPEEVPGCMKLLDDFLSCHGTFFHCFNVLFCDS